MDNSSSTAATRVTYAGTGALRNGTEFGTVTDTAPVSPDGDVVPGLIEVVWDDTSEPDLITWDDVLIGEEHDA